MRPKGELYASLQTSLLVINYRIFFLLFTLISSHVVMSLKVVISCGVYL